MFHKLFKNNHLVSKDYSNGDRTMTITDAKGNSKTYHSDGTMSKTFTDTNGKSTTYHADGTRSCTFKK